MSIPPGRVVSRHAGEGRKTVAGGILALSPLQPSAIGPGDRR